MKLGLKIISAVVLGCGLFCSSELFAAANGTALFVKNCALCHGKDGKATTPAARKLGVKDLTLSKLPDADIEKQILEGRKDDRGNQKMPPFKDKLAPQEIQALIVEVKRLRQ